MTDLLPCPFCGGDDLIEGVRFPRGSSIKEKAIGCASCGVRAPLSAWNQRVPLSDSGAQSPTAPCFELRHHITREMLRAEPDTLFVFGDNMAARGLGGQAKEMRGEHNAVGIPTKLLPDMAETSFFRDQDLHTVRWKIDRAFLRLAFHALKGGKIVWPAAGIGTGLAELEKRAPAIWQLIESGRKCLASPVVATDRDGGSS